VVDAERTALNQHEAIELLARLLTSAQDCLSDPPGYGFYRLARAADQLARAWAPRATPRLSEYLSEFAQRNPSEAAAGLDEDPVAYSDYLEDVIGVLASLVKEGATDGS
jgi:hypothetical protein